MSKGIDLELLAERSAAVGRHLERVADQLPADPAELVPLSSPTDAVVLHLWQAIQVVIDLAVSSCVRLGLGSPPTYADAFRASPPPGCWTGTFPTASLGRRYGSAWKYATRPSDPGQPRRAVARPGHRRTS